MAMASASGGTGAHRWTVPVCALLGVAVALALFVARTPLYEAEALVGVPNPAGPIAAEADFVTSTSVLDATERVTGLAPDITVTVADAANLVSIVARAEQAEDASLTANAVAAIYTDLRAGSAASIVSPAETPTSQAGLGPMVYAIIGTALGAVVGLAVAALQRGNTNSRP